ncbi:ion channel [Marinicella sp. W31]|uniref:ion channel n=1 Tax=Marinicella sp. W31 TaxID=3023713 RepID=UPI003757E128
MSWAYKFLRANKKRNLTKHLSSNIFRRVAKLLVGLSVLIIIHTVAMISFEKMNFKDALWLSFTTLTTVGYGDYSPSSWPGRISTILSMYLAAIWILSQLVSEIVDWKMVKSERKRKGLWEWKKMHDHIQIINTPNVDTERYLVRLISEIQKTPGLEELPVQLLTRKYPDGLPDSLSRLKVLHRTGRAEDMEIIHSIGLEKAKYIIILARDNTDSLSDSITFDILDQVSQINPDATVVAEAVIDANKNRFISKGAASAIRPVRAYPELIVRAMSNPGTERVLENLFQVEGDSFYKLPIKFSGIKWSDIVMQCLKMNIGTPLAFYQENELHTHPCHDEICNGDSIVAVVKENTHIDLEALQKALKTLA